MDCGGGEWRICVEMQNVFTAEVATKHEVEHEKAVFVILERVAKIDNEGVVDLCGEDK